MVRRLIPAAVLAAALVGCGKKVDVPGLGGGSDGSSPDATYTLKMTEKQAGDRFEVVETSVTATRNDSQVGEKRKALEASENAKYEYTELVEEVTAGRPVKVKRTYKVAEQKGKPVSFAGKTVDVQLLKNGQVSARLEKGGEVLGAEKAHFAEAVGRRDQLAFLLPTRPVKVNETFVLEPAQLEKVLGPADPNRTVTGDGRLTRAYTKNGRQYGVLELGFSRTTPAAGPQSESSVRVVIVLDGCVDGYALDGEVKVTTTEYSGVRDPKSGATHKHVLESVRTATVRPAAKP